jgi:hypothetical protein
LSLTGPWEYVVGTAVTSSVLRAQGGVDTTQNEGHVRKVLFNQPDTLLHARIPVGHSGSDQDSIWFDSLKKTLLEHFRSDAKAAIIALKLLQGRGFRYLSAVKLAGAKGLIKRILGVFFIANTVGRIVLAMARLIRHRILYLVSIMPCRRMNPLCGTIRPTLFQVDPTNM